MTSKSFSKAYAINRWQNVIGHQSPETPNRKKESAASRVVSGIKAITRPAAVNIHIMHGCLRSGRVFCVPSQPILGNFMCFYMGIKTLSELFILSTECQMIVTGGCQNKIFSSLSHNS